jgi:ADP-ribose pyrophosphatase YjhB (NUDIX family)
VQKQRDFGELVFLDLRDRTGVCQVVVDRERGASPDLVAAAKDLRSEFVVRIHGKVVERAEGQKNRKLLTGEVEVVAQQIEVGRLLGMPSPAQFFLIRADNAETLLQREEALTERLRKLETDDRIGGHRAISDWLPSQRRQQADAVLTGRVESAVMAQVGQALGESLARPDFSAGPLRPEAWLASPVSAPFRHQWLGQVGAGVPGYVTPKVGVAAVVGNDNDEILLVQRADSGIWLYPTGWADIGYSASEVAVKEVHEETGIECEVVRLIAVLDGLRLGFTRVPLYSLVFHCRAVGGDLAAHPLETTGVGFFGRDELPEPLAGFGQWGDLAFAAIRGEELGVIYDAPRERPWRG